MPIARENESESLDEFVVFSGSLCNGSESMEMRIVVCM